VVAIKKNTAEGRGTGTKGAEDKGQIKALLGGLPVRYWIWNCAAHELEDIEEEHQHGWSSHMVSTDRTVVKRVVCA